MSSDIINEEERVARAQQVEAAEIIRGTIRELCGLNERVIALDRSATVADAVNAMIQNRTGALLIVEDGTLCGMFSERDVLTRVVAQIREPAETPITEVMTPDPECLSLDDEIVFALNKMIVGGFRHIPILDKNGTAITVVSMRDVVAHIVSYYPGEVFNLPSDPAAGLTRQREGA
jgi:CBS domain-containing protein